MRSGVHGRLRAGLLDVLRRPLVDDLLQEVAREHNPLTGSTLNANPYHSQKGHGKWNAATPHSSKSQERYRWCAVGQAIPESAHDPQDAGLLEIHGRRAGCGVEITGRKVARPMGSWLDS